LILCDRFDLTPPFLADNIDLVADSGHRLLLSAADRTCRTTYTQHIRTIYRLT